MSDCPEDHLFGSPVPEPRVSLLALASLTAIVFAWGILGLTGTPAPLVAFIALLLAIVTRRVIRRRYDPLGGAGLTKAAWWLSTAHLVVTMSLLALGSTTA